MTEPETLAHKIRIRKPCVLATRQDDDDICKLLVDIWYHLSDTDDPELKVLGDRARALLDRPDMTAALSRS